MSDDFFLSSLLAVKSSNSMIIVYPQQAHTIRHTQGESVCLPMENDVYYHHH